jgi:hypothetical protein
MDNRKLCNLKEVTKYQAAPAPPTPENLPTADEFFGTKQPNKKPEDKSVGIYETLSYIPLPASILIGVVAAWRRRNGWKWGVLSFVALFGTSMVMALWPGGHIQPYIKPILFVGAFYGGMFWIVRRWWKRRKKQRD